MNVELMIPNELNPAGVRVRVVGTKDNPLFCLADVCLVLEIGNSRMVAERLDEDDVSLADIIDSMGRKQSATFVTETGLYTVLLRSDKPQAKPFRKWVTGEVLPCIRKHGCYPAPDADGKAVPPGLDGASPQARLLVLMAHQIATQEAENSRRWGEQEAWNGRVEEALKKPLAAIPKVDEGGNPWVSVDEYLRGRGLRGVNAMSLGVRAGQLLRRSGLTPQRIRSRNYYPRGTLDAALADSEV